MPPDAITLAGLVVILGAGVVRGFAGFGFSALTVAGFSVFGSPAEIVPVALVLEVLASLTMLRSAIRGRDRSWTLWLIVCNALCIPLGLLIFSVAPETWLRLLVGVVLLATASLLRAFEQVSVAPGALAKGFTGMASGLIQGVAASGGIAAAMLMTAARLSPARLRETMITYLLFAGPYTLFCAAFVSSRTDSGGALVNAQTLIDAAKFAPAMIAGIWIGKHAFAGTDPLRYRHFVLNLLILLSASGVGRALFDILRA